MKIQGDDKQIRLIPETSFEIQWLQCWSMENADVRKEKTLIGTTIILIENYDLERTMKPRKVVITMEVETDAPMEWEKVEEKTIPCPVYHDQADIHCDECDGTGKITGQIHSPLEFRDVDWSELLRDFIACKVKLITKTGEKIVRKEK